jgi:hypothetical protein
MRYTLLLFLFLAKIGFSQSPKCDSTYLVLDIYSDKDYHLIFLQKGDSKFTVFSAQNIYALGEEIKIGRTYCFTLKPNSNTLINDTVPYLINSDVIRYGHFKSYELGQIYKAKNLVGLILTR